MRSLLFQISVLFGGVVAALSLLINLVRRVDFLTAVFRAGIVFGVSLLICVFFLRFFAMVLHRFVTEEMVRHNAESQLDEETDDTEEGAETASSPPDRGTTPKLDVPRPNIPPRS